MTKEEYRKAIEDVIYLAACAVNETVPDDERAAGMNMPDVFRAAKAHMLTAAVGMALISAGIEDHAFDQEVSKAERKNALLDTDRRALIERLEQAGIWYMPLKGCVLKDLYPQYGMRQMADNDILIDAGRAEDVKVIMEQLGFHTKYYNKTNHDIYHKPPVSNFEIHKSLFGSRQEKKEMYYQDVKSRLIKDEDNSFGYHFSPEDFYIYITAHENKHYSRSGTGLRSLLDMYVFLKKYGQTLDYAYIGEETQKLDNKAFEEENRSLALHLFHGEPLTDREREMTEYVIWSGTFGNIDNSVEKRVNELGGSTKGRLRYFFNRLFMPLSTIKDNYPFVYRYKALLPFFYVFRLVKGVLFRRTYIKRELRALMKSNRSDK